MPFIRLAFVCLLSLSLAVSVQAQVESLNDARTFAEVREYIEYARGGVNHVLPWSEKRLLYADIVIAAGLKMLELAEDAREKNQAYSMVLHTLQHLLFVEEADQKLKTFLDGLAKIESQVLVDTEGKIVWNHDPGVGTDTICRPK